MKFSILLLAGIFLIVRPAPLSNDKDSEKIDGLITQLGHIRSMLKDSLKELEERKTKIQDDETTKDMRDIIKKTEKTMNFLDIADNNDETKGSDYKTEENDWVLMENKIKGSNRISEDNTDAIEEPGETDETRDDEKAVDRNPATGGRHDWASVKNEKQVSDVTSKETEETEWVPIKMEVKQDDDQKEETDDDRVNNQQNAETDAAIGDFVDKAVDQFDELEEEYQDEGDNELLHDLEYELSEF